MTVRTIYEYDLYFPSVSGERAGTSTEVFDDLKVRLTDFFGGLTDFRHRSEGAWKFGGITYQDEVILLRMLGKDRDAARAFLQSIRLELQSKLHEAEILIVEREVQAFSD